MSHTQRDPTRGKMAQVLKNGNMREQQSALRASFEADALPHLDALWRTALWLTMHGNAAEQLALETMTRAYRELKNSGDSVISKARLFRILTRVFFASGDRKRRWQQPTPFHSENVQLRGLTEGGNPQNKMAAIGPSQLLRLAAISDVSVKGAIARFRPPSRLLLLLLYRERFSYADIAFITDQSETTIKAMLSRIRRLIPGYILEIVARVREQSESQPVNGTDGSALDYVLDNASFKLPSLLVQHVPANAAAERWENEGGAVIGQGVGYLLCVDYL